MSRPSGRTIAVRLIVAFALTVAACSSSDSSPTTAGTDSTEPAGSGAGGTTTTADFDLPEPDRVDDVLARCPTLFDVDYVTGRIDLVFDADPTGPEPVCTEFDGSADLTRLQERAVQALLMMEATEFEEPLPWTDLQLFEWLTATIDGIRFRDDIEMSFCCDPDGYVNLQTGNLAALGTTRWIDPASGAGLIDLVALIVHEARHAEIGPHTCPDGMNDRTVAELGAWGVESLLYRWYADHSDTRFFDDPERPGSYPQMAGWAADRILETRFCGEGG